MIRLLKPEEIEVRVAQIKKNGLSLLLYKDARVDQNILDETFGIMGWKREHKFKNGSLFCTISIKDPETGDWIKKEDVGTPSYSDPIKGAASDAFKRAAVNIGIGRELYTAPFIWISADKTDILEKNDRIYCNDHFKVAFVDYDEDKRSIKGLVIENQKHQSVFVFGNENSGNKTASNKLISKSQLQLLQQEMIRTGVTESKITERFGLEGPLDHMSEDIYSRVMNALAKTKRVA